MAIDPMLYEKISGRKGDPYARMGEALAGSDAAKSRRTAEKERSYTEASMLARYKFQMYFAGAGVIALVLFLIARAIFG
jgi:hypothetical protein